MGAIASNNGKSGIAQTDPNSAIKTWEDFKTKTAQRQKKKRPRPVTKKLPQYHRHQTLRIAWRLLLIFLIFGTGLVGLGYYISPYARIATVSVKGVEITAAQDVIDASQLNTESNVLLTVATRRKLEQRLKQELPALRSVTVILTNWNKIELRVKEEPTVGFFAKKDGYQRIFANGKLDSQLMNKPIGNFPVYAGFTPGTALNNVIQLYAQIPDQIQNAISEIKSDPSQANPYRIHLYMNDGNEVIADSRTVIKRLKYYGNIVSQTTQKGIVDLEVGAFFTPFSK
ncbi:cell division protein FtsQ/DivIB [Lapidilactobacillus luobeiensis]|uniref:cell division protein FtsQ/DivIB n=1 Tax=Lapidilactobacillus luobeiensis TaxID=2950371 RepID=UPI0021C47776|nr:cell division protein FtsQ/DivIB [Lapidilactobacillus luobeiensis]